MYCLTNLEVSRVIEADLAACRHRVSSPNIHAVFIHWAVLGTDTRLTTEFIQLRAWQREALEVSLHQVSPTEVKRCGVVNIKTSRIGEEEDCDRLREDEDHDGGGARS